MIKQASIMQPLNRKKVYIVETLHDTHFVSASSREDAIEYVKDYLIGLYNAICGCRETVEVYIA